MNTQHNAEMTISPPPKKRELSKTAETKADRIARRLGQECDGASTKEQLRALQRAVYKLARTLGTGYRLEQLPKIAGLYEELIEQTAPPGRVNINLEESVSVAVYGLNISTPSGEFETLGSDIAELIAGAVTEKLKDFDVDCQDGDVWLIWNP